MPDPSIALLETQLEGYVYDVEVLDLRISKLPKNSKVIPLLRTAQKHLCRLVVEHRTTITAIEAAMGGLEVNQETESNPRDGS